MEAIEKFLKRNISPRNWFLVFILITLSTYLFVFKLGEPSLWNMDEPIYGEVAKEILKLGDWITLHFNYSTTKSGLTSLPFTSGSPLLPLKLLAGMSLPPGSGLLCLV